MIVDSGSDSWSPANDSGEDTEEEILRSVSSIYLFLVCVVSYSGLSGKLYRILMSLLQAVNSKRMIAGFHKRLPLPPPSE